MSSLSVLSSWPTRRWLTAVGAAAAYVLLVGVSTAMIETPVFGREIPPTWWSWPALLLASVLTGLLTATYVRRDGEAAVDGGTPAEPGSRRGMVGAVLTWFAVGCPVCNKLVLLALGYAGALTWFQPLQPLLYAVALAALAWALQVRLRGELTCPVGIA